MAPDTRHQEQPSVLRTLNDSARRLAQLQGAMHASGDGAPDLRAIARELLVALEQGSDIALAAILLNQVAGTHAVRHAIETALLAMLAGHSMQQPHGQLLDTGIAALALSDHAADTADAAAPGTPEQALVALASQYCTLVSSRNYLHSALPDQALQTIFLDRQSDCERLLAQHFMQVLGTYPPGTLVRLRSGELGVVTRRGATLIHPLTTPQGVPLSPTELARALPRTAGASAACAIVGAVHESEAQLHFSMRHVWGDAARL